MGNFLDRVRVVHSTGTGSLNSNQTDFNSSSTDVGNYDGVMMLSETATVAASGTIEFQWQDSADNSTWADIGSDTLDIAASDDNVPILYTLSANASDHYVRMAVDKGGGNSQLTCLYLLRYGLQTGLPGGQPSSTSVHVDTMPVPFTKRYLRVNFDKGTANSAFRTAMYLRYGPHHKPATQATGTKHGSLGDDKLISNIRVDVAMDSGDRAAGSADVAGNSLDMSGGWAGVVLITYTGTITGAGTVHMTWQESDDNATWTQIGEDADRQAVAGTHDSDHFYYEIHSGDSGASW